MFEVWQKEPSTQAARDIFDRLLDKPKEQEQDIKVDGDLVIRWQS